MSPLRRATGLCLAATLVLSPLLTACGGPSADQVAPEQALTLIQTNDAVTVLDVRTPEEYASGHLSEAVNVSLADEFEEQLEGLDPDAAYVVYCTTGARSAEASSIMLDNGFSSVVDAGGIEQLAAAGAEVVTGG